MYSIFSKNSEADATEFLENIENVLPLYYMHSDNWNRIKSPITPCATRREGVHISLQIFESNAAWF